MTTLRIQLPFLRPPLSMNDRKHWSYRQRQSKLLRTTACVLTRQERNAKRIHVLPPIVIDLVWIVTDNRRRDADNPAATRKPVVDGVCDALGIDDDWRTVSGGVRIEKGETAGLWVEVRQASEATE